MSSPTTADATKCTNMLLDISNANNSLVLPPELYVELENCSNAEFSAALFFFFQSGLALFYFCLVCLCGCCENKALRARLTAPLDLALTRPSRFLSVCIAVLLADSLALFVSNVIKGTTPSSEDQVLITLVNLPFFFLPRYSHNSCVVAFLSIVLLGTRLAVNIIFSRNTFLGEQILFQISDLEPPPPNIAEFHQILDDLEFVFPTISTLLQALPTICASAAGILFLLYVIFKHGVETRFGVYLREAVRRFESTQIMRVLLVDPMPGYVMHTEALFNDRSPERPKHFLYSTRFCMTIGASLTICYRVLLFALDTILHVITLAMKFTLKAPEELSSFSPGLPLFANKKIYLDTVIPIATIVAKGLVGASVGVSCLVWIVCIILVSRQPSVAYKTGILRLRAGDYWFDRSQVSLHGAMTLFGTSLGYVAAGVLYLILTVALCLVVIVSVLVIFYYLPPEFKSLIWNFIRDRLVGVLLGPGVIMLLVTLTINLIVIPKFLTSDEKMRIIHPRIASFIDIFFTAFVFFSAVLSFSTYIIKCCALAAVILIQIHRPVMGIEKISADVRHSAFVSAMLLDHSMNNPIVRTAIALLREPLRSRVSFGRADTAMRSECDELPPRLRIESVMTDISEEEEGQPNVREKLRRQIRAVRARLPPSKPYTSKDLRTLTEKPAEKIPDGIEAMGEEEKRDREELAVLHRRMVNLNRWFVAVMLVRNSSLIEHRRGATIGAPPPESLFTKVREAVRRGRVEVVSLIAKQKGKVAKSLGETSAIEMGVATPTDNFGPGDSSLEHGDEEETPDMLEETPVDLPEASIIDSPPEKAAESGASDDPNEIRADERAQGDEENEESPHAKCDEAQHIESAEDEVCADEETEEPKK